MVGREKAKDGSVLAVRMQVDQGNSGGLASAPWPAWHNDPAQGRSDLHLNSRGGLLSLHIHSQRSLGPTQKLPLVQNPQNPWDPNINNSFDGWISIPREGLARLGLTGWWSGKSSGREHEPRWHSTPSSFPHLPQALALLRFQFFLQAMLQVV